MVLTFSAAGGGALGPVRLTKAPQQCFGVGSCDVFEVTADSKLGELQHAKVNNTQSCSLDMLHSLT